MAYVVVGGSAGVIWLWFWVQGNWFAALLAAIALGWFPLIDDKRSTEWVLCLACLVVPWVPMLLRLAIRRLAHDAREIAGADAKFSESLSLEIRGSR